MFLETHTLTCPHQHLRLKQKSLQYTQTTSPAYGWLLSMTCRKKLRPFVWHSRPPPFNPTFLLHSYLSLLPSKIHRSSNADPKDRLGMRKNWNLISNPACMSVTWRWPRGCFEPQFTHPSNVNENKRTHPLGCWDKDIWEHGENTWSEQDSINSSYDDYW